MLPVYTKEDVLSNETYLEMLLNKASNGNKRARDFADYLYLLLSDKIEFRANEYTGALILHLAIFHRFKQFEESLPNNFQVKPLLIRKLTLVDLDNDYGMQQLVSSIESDINEQLVGVKLSDLPPINLVYSYKINKFRELNNEVEIPSFFDCKESFEDAVNIFNKLFGNKYSLVEHSHEIDSPTSLLSKYTICKKTQTTSNNISSIFSNNKPSEDNKELTPLFDSKYFLGNWKQWDCYNSDVPVISFLPVLIQYMKEKNLGTFAFDFLNVKKFIIDGNFSNYDINNEVLPDIKERLENYLELKDVYFNKDEVPLSKRVDVEDNGYTVEAYISGLARPLIDNLIEDFTRKIMLFLDCSLSNKIF